MTQFHVLRRLAPIVGPLQTLADAADAEDAGHVTAFKEFAEAIGSLSDEATNYVLDKILRTVEMQQSPTVWARIKPDGVLGLMFKEIDMIAMLMIASHVIRENYAAVFQNGLASSNGGAQLPQ
jgi:hypothetical protein